MDKIALKLQERLVQTCIDFINEYKDDEQVKDKEKNFPYYFINGREVYPKTCYDYV